MIRQKIVRLIAKLLKVELPKEYIDPVPKIYELDDDKNKCYIWKLREDSSQKQVYTIIDTIYTEFVKKNGRDPNALHVVCNDIQEIKEMDSKELEQLIIPWIKSNKNKK